uniref:furin n=1 Tax=Rhipicephalus appendiculatus TaxID=34631 RepID=A0A131YEU3_RHIAP
MTRILLVAVALIFFVGPINSAEVYTDQFVVHVEGGAELARELANKHGFEYLGQVFGDHYHLRHKRIAKRSLQRSEEHHRSLEQEPSVRSFSQQTLKRRSKREFRETVLNDPRWSEMWYLNRGKSLDMNVQNVWKKNITGRGVVVTILDDGLEKDHPDLVENYDPQASWDMNNHDPDPQPRYDLVDSNRHGTRCAGEVAAVKNNSICAVGVAFGAGIGGVRMLDGDVTDVVEARSLALNNQHIDVYSASWGPDDDGKTVDGPGELATRAFREGIERGRGGLGSIFVWASGNGGRERDNCNCDGYTNAIWTLSISSATENGLVPWYSEACSSTLATTYSSGSTGERQIITTDLHHGCTSTHTGTSASAPLAAGICALALEANRRLTWRDMQHIVVRTAKPANLHTSDWQKNGVGRNVSHSFGYGLMDADAMVALAKRWTTVPQQKTCMVRAQPLDKYISPKSHVELKLNVNCENVRFLEHVQAKVTLSATRRGDLHIYLTSPAGTRSTLLAQRPLDNSRSGFQAWPFMSVHTWGESPNGRWKLEVHNDGRYFGKATLKEWSLILYGTSEDPDVWSAGAGARPPPQYGDVPSGPHEENEKEAPPTPAAPQTTRKTTTKAPTTLRPSPPPVPISPTAKAFPVYRPMKPPPSLGRPPSDHESLDNFIHSDSRRPGEPITFVRQIVHVLQNAFAPFRPQPTYYIQIA